MVGCARCNGQTIPIGPQYGHCMNSYLNGDAWNYVPPQWKKAIQNIKKESMVMNPSRVFFFSEENPRPTPGLSDGGVNDNNLRSTPNCTTDCWGSA